MDLELLAMHEFDRNGMIVHLKPNTSTLMTFKLASEIRALQDSLAKKIIGQCLDNYCVIWYLHKSKNFSRCGLDYNFIFNCFKNHDEKKLEEYIDKVFDVLFLNYVGLGLPIINCSFLTDYLPGLSKEFFFMNKISFIYQNKYKCLKKINLVNEIKNLTFKKETYDKNHYYFYNPIHIRQMKEIIEKITYEIPGIEEVNEVKNDFEALKKLIVTRLYKIASRNINILERLARNDREDVSY
ncbi:hypothetical protein [Legionella shakespearei]|uniref:Uncharacterized protein n=1 Tax=Legionella shakespearei DSM 23087 TaxID=1122169 RepID=A0A0W0YST8_9GAMM|nr:hypothetical protein [Legionella shakespearei]KTD59936.1 hypothetical protein Lsha_1686 [Legionella shakespearei DSM 23087]